MHRALPLTVRIPTRKTSPRLRRCTRTIIRAVNLAVMLYALFDSLLFRITPWDLEKLQWMLCHYAACLND